MRILFLSDNFPPEVNAPAQRTSEHCNLWAKQGATVTVITCAPNFPQGRVYPGYRNRLYQREAMDGVRVIRVWTYITANRGFLRRTLDYLSFAFSSFSAGLFQPADVIIATSPQFFTTVGAWLLATVKRKPWIFEVRDLWPESIEAVGAMKPSRLIRWLEKLELFLYRKAAAIVVVTDSFRANLERRGIPPGKIFVVKNGARLDEYSPRPKDREIVEKLNLEGKFVVAYVGTHGMAHKLDFILQCAERLRNDEQIKFLLIGDGAEKQRLLQQARELKLSNVVLLDPVPKSEVPRYLSVSDAALVALKRSPTFRGVIPSKIFENAAMQRPILLGVDGEARELVEKYEAGIFFEPEDEKSFIAALYRLKDDKELYGRCRRGCERLARDFDRERLAREMYEVIKKASRGRAERD